MKHIYDQASVKIHAKSRGKCKGAESRHIRTMPDGVEQSRYLPDAHSCGILTFYTMVAEEVNKLKIRWVAPHVRDP
ncbi:MAG: hypothetical protein ACJAX5_002425 [Patiriisocius sp.]|jgi:hypothetical protein